MILSMTGYGRAEGSFNNKKIQVEIKSLNGKTTDVRFKTPAYFKEKELFIRNIIIDHAKRGKVDFSITVDSDDGEEEYGLNMPLVKKYIENLTSLQKEYNLSNHDWISSIFRIPNVIQQHQTEMSDEEWERIKEIVTEALDNLKTFRSQEGVAMHADLSERVASIQDLLNRVKKYEDQRIIAVRERLKRNLEEFVGKENVDKNRYEQEVIFYMEKLDINEEKVRLTQHCEFFLKQLNSEEETSGRKLSFIAQEMGREINTLGSKAQHSSIQQLVVNMKDDLEKIKEQLANIL